MKTTVQLLLSALFLAQGALAQPDPQIEGPYEFFDPPPFHVRVAVHFVEPDPANPTWTQGLDLAERQTAILSRLNAAFNEHRIFFVLVDDPCQGPGTFSLVSQVSDLTPSAIDIFDRGPTEDVIGNAFTIPSGYLEVGGTVEGTPTALSTVLIHEMGHALGLLHTHDNSVSCSPSPVCNIGFPDCYCCEDFVCDTESHDLDLIELKPDCSAPLNPNLNLPEAIWKNYMSYTEPAECRSLFTPEQVRRMWVYLSEAPVLRAARVLPTQYPDEQPTSPSGNIVVKSGSELIIEQPLEMLPGAYIRVERGATLHIKSTLTAACDDLWQGIIVVGNEDVPQTPARQGQVLLPGSGLIEHARCGIFVGDLDEYGEKIPGSGGGIVKVLAGGLENNEIGIHFERYSDNGKRNISSLINPRFKLDDNYRGSVQQPVFLEMFRIVQLDIQIGRFRDLRSNCPGMDQRAIGIDAFNASFRVFNGTLFENLAVGIRVDRFDEDLGSFRVFGSDFRHCRRGFEAFRAASFEIRKNDFFLGRPSTCPPSSSDITGVFLRGNTTGLEFSDNTFTYEGTEEPSEILVGSNCYNLLSGLNNTIRRNSYINLHFGNQASGNNGYDPDGLLYLCNFHSFGISKWAATPYDY